MTVAGDAALTPARRRGWQGRVAGETESDLDRVRRIGARFLGAGLVGYLLVSLGGIGQTAALTASWWPPVSVLLAVGPGIALVAASFRPGTAWLSPLAIAASLGYLTATATWFLAWNGSTTARPDDPAFWMMSFCGMPSMVLMLVRPRLSVAHLLVAATGAGCAQQIGRFGHLTPDLALEVLWSVSYTFVFLAVVLVAVRTATTLDATRDDAYRRAATVAADGAREVEQSRFDAIIHDRVIASLLAVRTGRPDTRLVAQARSALAELEHLGRGDSADTADQIDTEEALRRIRSAVADVTDTAEVDVVAVDADGRFPPDAVFAIVEAMREALRNVMRHAGADAACGVLGQFADGGISLAVVDDGCGFDLGDRAPGRLGIEVSIRKRMAQLPGGSARLRSTPGRGTTVVLSWERPR